jgi:hypothetical protein
MVQGRQRRHAEPAGPEHGVDDLSVHIQLALTRCGVADPYRTRLLVAGQPAQHILVQPPFPAEAVHDLEIFWIAGDRAQRPVAPLDRLLDVAGRHKRVEREGGVA